MNQARIAATPAPGRTTRLILLATVGLAAVGPPALPAVPLKSILELRSLPTEVLLQLPEARVRGVVTFRGNAHIVLQDDTAGIYVDFATAARNGVWQGAGPPADVRVGDEVEIEGLAHHPHIAPGLWPRTVVNRGPAALPEVRPADEGRFFSGDYNCSVVAFTGVVHRLVDADTHWRIGLAADGRRFSAFIAKPVLAEAVGIVPPVATAATLEGLLVDAEVRVAGPVLARTSDDTPFFEPQVNVSLPAWFTVVTPPPCEPFAAPEVAIEMLSRQRTADLRRHRLRTSGIVTYAVPGRFLVLQRGIWATRVETVSPAGFAVGEEVEASGFLAWRGETVGLVDAVVRSLGPAAQPAPAEIGPPVEAAFTKTDGLLASLVATLVDVRPAPMGGVLTLSADDVLVTATVPAAAFAALRGLAPGAVLRVTGVCEVSWRSDPGSWPSKSIDSLRLLARSAADVRVVKPAPWWTSGRLAAVVAALTAVAAAAAAWIAVLRREVRRQSGRAIAEALARRKAGDEYEAALRERGRIAADLHDTLLQTITGIDYQLQFCAADARPPLPADTLEHLGLARSLVGHAARQLRSTVWSLRTMPDLRQPFADAVGELAGLLAAGHGVRVDVRATGDPCRVHETVTRQLLFVVQEAMLNAMHHGNARTVTITIGFAPASAAVEIALADDGCGFTPGAERGPEAGHFGIQGMRERVESLAGEFAIDGGRGRGTTVWLRVPEPGRSPATHAPFEFATEPAA